MLLRLLILVPACGTLVLAQDKPPAAPQPAPEAAVEPVKPNVKKLDDTRYQVGGVIFDQKTREIRFPTKVNMIEGLLEYLIVHQNGKVHEALLTTDISPSDLNLAFTLLRYPPSRELYPLPDEGGAASSKFPEVPADIKARARLAIDVEWTVDGKVRRIPVNEWIQHAVKATSMPAGPWVYGGSEFSEGKFIPETSGDIAAIFLAMSALINYPGTDNNNDDVWTPFPKRVPAEGTNVTVIIAPFQKENPLPKP
ncbi:MAG: YdjY domain-containing protein [Verrucomicrobiota bacterium]